MEKETNNAQEYLPKKPLKPKAYENHGRINITSDSNFTAQASIEGWVGSGIQVDPYIIENYNITQSETDPIAINLENISVFFVIRNCWLKGAQGGIYLTNVSNGIFDGNLMTFIMGHGVRVDIESYNNTFRYNNFNVTTTTEWANAFCENSTNNFLYNYWDDINAIDTNEDGINDTGYTDIQGGGGCSDATPRVFEQYRNHLPIDLTYDEEVAQFAADEGLPGNGSPQYPYIIADINISSPSSFDSIYLHLSGVSIIIDGCTFIGGGRYTHIQIEQASNIAINNSILINAGNYGIYCHLYEMGFCQNITIENTQIINGCSDAAICFFTTRDSVIRNVIIDNCTGIGVELHSESKNNTLIDSTITNCTSYGFRLYNQAHNNTIISTQIVNCSNSGISISDCENTTINNVTSKFSGITGIDLQMADFTTIGNSSVANNTDYGINVVNTNNFTLISSFIHNHTHSPYAGLFFSTAENVTIHNSSFRHNYKGVESDYWATAFSQVLITNTLISNSTYRGFYARRANYVTIIDTFIVNTSNEYGLYCHHCNNVTVINCTIDDNKEAGICFMFTHDSEVINSTIKNSRPDGEGYGGPGFYFRDTSNINLTMNEIINNTGYGIYLYGGGNYSIFKNTIQNNGYHGAYLWSTCSDSDITNNTFIDNGQLSPITSQAYDYRSPISNLFEFNFWSDYNGIDADRDGIGDTPYDLDGPANNTDDKPVVELIPLIFDFGDGTLANQSIVLTNNSIWLNITYDFTIDKMWYEINGGDPIFFTENETWTPILPDGVYLIIVYANDTLSNVYQTDELNFVINAVPSIFVSTPANGTTIETDEVIISVDYDVPGSELKGVWNETHSIAFTNNQSTLTGLTNGYYIVTITANNSGFVNSTVIVFTISTEQIIPATVELTIIYPTGSLILNGTEVLSWSVNDTSQEWTYLIEYSRNLKVTWQTIDIINSSASTVTYSWDTTLFVDGFYQLRVLITNAGITGSDTTSVFRVDNDPIWDQIDFSGTFNLTDTISVTIYVFDPVNVSVKLIATGPATPDNLTSLDIYINITFKNPSALMGLWINVSFVELDKLGVPPENVRIHYYNEETNTWEQVTNTGVDYENEVVWGFSDHVTVFGVMDEKAEIPPSGGIDWLLIALLGLLLAVPVIIGVVILQQKVKGG